MIRYHINLNRDDLAGYGIPEPWAFGIGNRTTFGELDALNHVNNTVYLRWMETLRIAHLGARKVTDFGADGPRLVLRQVGQDYLAEMGMGQDYIVTGRTARFRKTSFTQEYAVWAMNDGQPPLLTSTGHAVIVLLEPDGSGGFPIPDAARQAFIDLDGAVQE